MPISVGPSSGPPILPNLELPSIKFRPSEKSGDWKEIEASVKAVDAKIQTLRIGQSIELEDRGAGIRSPLRFQLQRTVKGWRFGESDSSKRVRWSLVRDESTGLSLHGKKVAYGGILPPTLVDFYAIMKRNGIV